MNIAALLGTLLAGLIGGALYGLPFVAPALAPLAFVGVAPALFALSRDRVSRSVAATMAVSWLASAVLVAACGQMLLRVSIGALIVQGGSMAPWVWAGFLAFTGLRRRTGWPAALLWPCCWVLTEWGVSYHSLGALAFGLSGYTQFNAPRLIQITDVTGVLGVGFLVQAVVGGWADAAATLMDSRDPLPGRLRAALAPLAAALGLVALALVYGTVRLHGATAEPGPRLAMIQPAIRHGMSPSAVQLVQIKQVALARRHVSPGSADLVVFPENAVIGLIDNTPYLREFQDLSRELRAPLLVGLTTHTDENTQRVRRGLPPLRTRTGNRSYLPGHNSAAVITPEGLVAKYDKRHLLPFSEQVPGEPFFEAIGGLDRYHAFLNGTLGYMGQGVPGGSTRLLTVPGTRYPPYWTPICFEQADARLSREAAREGARCFINITSEGDLGDQIYTSTQAVAVLRAAELHVGIARCGNMGITSIIDPWGRQTHRLRGKTGALWGEPGVLHARLPIGPPGPTLYARLGDWPAGLAGLLILGASIASLRPSRRRRAETG